MGVPLHLQVAKRLSNTLLEEPRFYLGALRVAVAQGYNLLNHRGWLHGVSPEAIAHVMIFAVADAVRSDAGNTKLLSVWKRYLLSTAFTFHVLNTPEERVWHALKRRGLWQCQVTLVVHRSCFHMCHEVDKVRQLLAETTSADVTSQTLYDAYRENLGPGRALSYFETVSAVLRKMFAVPF